MSTSYISNHRGLENGLSFVIVNNAFATDQDR